MSAAAPEPAPGQSVWVVFSGRADLPWLRLLRPGFRHCFLAVSDGARWVTLDPLASRLVLAYPPVAGEFDLPAFYLHQGLSLRGPFQPRPPQRRLLPPLAPFSCVTVAKRVLGVRATGVLTPWQLYRFLGQADKEKIPRKKDLTESV